MPIVSCLVQPSWRGLEMLSWSQQELCLFDIFPPSLLCICVSVCIEEKQSLLRHLKCSPTSWLCSCSCPLLEGPPRPSFVLTFRYPPIIQPFSFYHCSKLRFPFYLRKHFFVSFCFCVAICFRYIILLFQVRHKLFEDRNDYRQWVFELP